MSYFIWNHTYEKPQFVDLSAREVQKLAEKFPDTIYFEAEWGFYIEVNEDSREEKLLLIDDLMTLAQNEKLDTKFRLDCSLQSWRLAG